MNWEKKLAKKFVIQDMDGQTRLSGDPVELKDFIESLLKEAEADGVSLGIDAMNGDEEAKNKVIKILVESTNKIRNRVFPEVRNELGNGTEIAKAYKYKGKFIVAPMKKLLCKIFGHRTSGDEYSGQEYLTVHPENIDGIGRWHATIKTECKRCGQIFRVGKIHIPQQQVSVVRAGFQ